MKVRWEKRGQKYYAYLRESKFVNGKTATTNVYLGNDLVTAKGKLFDYLRVNGIPDSGYSKELHRQAVEFNVPNNLRGDELQRQQEREKLYDELYGLIEDIPNAKTIELRQKLHRKLNMKLIEYRIAMDKS